MNVIKAQRADDLIENTTHRSEISVSSGGTGRFVFALSFLFYLNEQKSEKMETVGNVSNFINGIQCAHLNWEYFSEPLLFSYVYRVILLSVAVAGTVLNIVVSAFLFPTYTRSACV